MEIQENGMNVFQYCDQGGRVIEPSSNHIAAISNKAGNVLAMSPFPGELLSEAIFQSMRDYIQEGNRRSVSPLYYYPR
jgi:phosphoribosylformylglycinamidine (FGAM) synthase-like amidotransferase family enzyme